jgi:hypothetical protein
MKMQWAQVLLIVFAMYYLSACERDASKESNRLMIETIKEVSKEVRNVKSELLDTNIKLIETKIQLSRFHSDMNAHNLKMQRKTL